MSYDSLYEARLTAEERKQIPKKLFGIPEESKFPLVDEAHVSDAVTYFRTAPISKRKSLAERINKRAKDLGMKIKVSDTNPFRRYADKDILSEAALTTEERKSIPKKLYGLPEEGKYPLNDEKHVLMAIRFFKYCPLGKRNELSNNINKRAKELGMAVKVSKDSAFYRYASKDILTESSMFVDMGSRFEIPENYTEIPDVLEQIGMDAYKAFDQLIVNMYQYASFDGMIQFEKKVMDIMWDYDKFRKTNQAVIKGDICLNPFKYVNDYIKQIYMEIFDYIEYSTGIQLKETRMVYEIFEDLFFCVSADMEVGRLDKVTEKMNIACNIVDSQECNTYHVARKIRQLQFQRTLRLYELMRNNDDGKYTELIHSLESLADVFGDYMKTVEKALPNAVIIQSDFSIPNIIQTPDMYFVNFIDYLTVIKKELENEINIIYMEFDSIISDTQSQNMEFYLDDLRDKNATAFNILTFLEGSICDDNVKMYDKDLCIYLQANALMIFNKVKFYDHLFIGKDSDGCSIYYGVTPTKLYLLTQKEDCDEMTGCDLYAILLSDTEARYEANLSNFICGRNGFDATDKLRAIRITPNRLEGGIDTSVLTEGIDIDENGNVSFSFSPKKSLMDEYAENHKILIANSKAGNTEAMKVNLAFLFELINYVEREYIHKKSKSVSSDEQKNAEKARMFAINDFKRYMQQVQQADPKFNFTEYYQNSEYGKTTITVKRESVSGIKKLFHTIMFA